MMAGGGLENAADGDINSGDAATAITARAWSVLNGGIFVRVGMALERGGGGVLGWLGYCATDIMVVID